MFWNKFDSMLSKESSVQEVLLSSEPEKITLRDLMEKEDCIQETKARNPQLVKVLIRPEVLLQLVHLVVDEPTGQIDDKARFKDATTACEMLNADVPEITEALVQTPEYLDVLLGLFACSDVLNPILTSFVTRTFGLLISRKPENVLNYLMKKESLLDITLKHLNITAVTDLYIRIITAHENDNYRYRICEWLNSQRLLDRVAGYLDATVVSDADYHANAAQLISDIIRFSREQQLQQLKPDDEACLLTPDTYANALLKMADSENFISLVVSILVKSASSQSAVVHCLAVLGAPFEYIPVNFDGNTEQKALFSELSLCVVNSRIDKYTKILAPVISNLHEILLNPPMRNTLIGQLAEGDVSLTNRVGQTRLQLVRLFALLLSFGRTHLNQAFFKCGLIMTLLSCINLILHNTPMTLSDPLNVLVDHPLLYQLIITGRLHDRLLQAWKSNAEAESFGKPRRPYMGHLLAVCLELSNDRDPKYPLLQLVMADVDRDTAEQWKEFWATTIKPLADIQSRCLAGVHPLQAQSMAPLQQQQPPRANVAEFEYLAKSHGSPDEGTLIPAEGKTDVQITPGDASQKKVDLPSQPIIDSTVDEAMRLSTYDEDDEDEDDAMDGTSQAAQRSSEDAPMAVSKKPTPTPDWPSIQPLHVAEKDGIKRMEELENSNSPWDVTMKPVSAPVFAWESTDAKPIPAANSGDAWADFSAFSNNLESGPDNMSVSSAQHFSPNLLESDDAPFEFRASCLTPDPVDGSPVENGESYSRHPGGDASLPDPFRTNTDITNSSSEPILSKREDDLTKAS